jgi:hypothetical protein
VKELPTDPWGTLTTSEQRDLSNYPFTTNACTMNREAMKKLSLIPDLDIGHSDLMWPRITASHKWRWYDPVNKLKLKPSRTFNLTFESEIQVNEAHQARMREMKERIRVLELQVAFGDDIRFLRQVEAELFEDQRKAKDPASIVEVRSQTISSR